MPNVDDHGLEVLKKAARNIDPVPKRDYALQVILVKDESTGDGVYIPDIINHNIAVKDVEETISLPVGYKAFILRPRRNCRLKLAFTTNGTNTQWVTIPRGGYWVENRKFNTNDLFIQSDTDNVMIEVVVYK